MQKLIEQPTQVIIPANGQVKAAVIWLHGLGANGYDFVPAIPMLQLPETTGIEFIFPHAPAQAVTLNGGVSMPAWFDIYGLEAESAQDEAGMRRASQALYHLISQVKKEKQLSSEKIVLVGFSQGAALALYAGLRYSERLAGIACLSGFLPMVEKLAEERTAINHDTPIFMAHGRQDYVLPFAFGQMSYQFLKQLNYPANFHAYPMAHTVCEEEMRALGQFIRQVIC